MSRVLSGWFARFAATDAESNEALSTLQRLGGGLSDDLWDQLALAFHVADPKPACRYQWAVVLVAAAPNRRTDLLDVMLAACRWPEDKDLALLLVDHLLGVVVSLKPSLAAPSPDDEQRLAANLYAATSLRGGDHWLRAWTNVLRPNLPDCVNEVLAVAERHLRDAHRRLRLLGKATDRWDPTSFARSAIEPHEQDRPSADLNALIDIARDSIEHLLADDPDAASATVERWAASEGPILRRLAIHAWAVRTDRTPDDKIEHAIAAGWLYAPSTKHETFHLINAALPNAADVTIEALVNAATGGVPDLV